MTRIILAITIWAVFFMSLDAHAAYVRNEAIHQQGGRVIITYDLEGTARELSVDLTLTTGGRVYTGKDLHFEGDLGRVVPGRGKRVVWNVLLDFPGGLRGPIEVELSASGEFMEMSFIQGGCFVMGCLKGDNVCEADETPPHKVCLDDFYMGKYEVTQGQWRELMGAAPSFNAGCDDCPVEQIKWEDALEFLGRLSKRTGRKYRLPTEAEWEYAARGRDMDSLWSGTSNASSLKDFAWLTGNSGGRTHPVGQRKPNSLGLYDMTGNVWEWCADWYDDRYYGASPLRAPRGPKKGAARIARGGSWSVGPSGARNTFRSQVSHGSINFDLGFRVAASR